MKEKILFFLLIFCYVLSVTFFYINPTFNLDGYCQISMGFNDYSQLFYLSGRFVTGILWYLFGLIKMSHNVLSIISLLLTNIFLSLSVIRIYKTFLKYSDSFIKKVILLISSVLIIYNPYVMEVFIYEESFLMALSILFVIIASEKCFNKKYIWGLLLLVLSNMMYQGNICLFIPYYFLILLFENKDKSFKELLSNNIKRILLTGMVYGLSLAIVYGLMKFYIAVLGGDSIRNGSINIVENIKLIIHFIIDDIKGHQGMINPYVYDITLGVLFLFVVIQLFVKKKITQIVYVCLLMTFLILCAYVPNIVMPSGNNYVAARMIISCGALIGFCSLCSLLLNKKLVIVLVLISGFFVFNSYNYIISAKHDYDRYKNDMEAFDLIKSNIMEYEDSNDVIIREVKFMISPSSDAYYYFGNKFSPFSYRVLHNDWGFICGVQGFINNEYVVSVMNSEEYELYFADKEYDDFSKNTMVFVDDILYILIF